MNNRLLWFLTLLLTGPLLARAQEVPSSYQAEYDSLTQRAARVRALVDGRIAWSHSSFLALAGTSRRIKSFARGRTEAGKSSSTSFRLIKKQITKHKTHSADVAKVYYYAANGKLVLAELYQQRLLVRVQLYEYGQRDGRTLAYPYRKSEWVRGDYLHLSLRNATGDAGRPRNDYFTAPRPPETDLPPRVN